MDPHRFRPELQPLETRETPSASPADVNFAMQFAQTSAGVLRQLQERLAGPLRTDTINEIKNFLPALAWLNAGAANLLGGFQTDLATEAALNPPAAPLLAPLVAWTGGGQVRAQATAAGADVLGVTLGAPSLGQQVAALTPPAPTADTASGQSTDQTSAAPADGSTPPAANPTPPTPGGTDPGTGTGTGTDSGTGQLPPLSTSDASGMSDTIPDVNDPHWQAMPDGLRVWDVVEGDGTAAAAGSNVTVYYTGWLKSDGTQFETDRTSGPNTFSLAGLIQGWQEGIPGMKPGGLRRLDIPAALAYGTAGSPPKIPGNADLVFEIKMLAVN